MMPSDSPFKLVICPPILACCNNPIGREVTFSVPIGKVILACTNDKRRNRLAFSINRLDHINPSNKPSLETLEILLQSPAQSNSFPPSQGRRTAPSPAKRAAKMLERGFLGRASRALIDPTPIAADTAENRAILLKKHPIDSKDPFLGKTRPRPGQPITEEVILASIATIGKEKAPGLSGWTRPLLNLVSKAGSSVIAFLRLVSDMIRQGTAPGADLLCASRLIGLEKLDGGIRPFAIGDLIYKVAMKAILKTSFSSSMLLHFQLGVSSPGEVEPAIFHLEEAIAGPNKADFQYITSVDLHNAFNSGVRPSIASSVASFAPTFYKAATWAYNNPLLLVLPEGSTVASSKGVRQGDPIGPLLFSLSFTPTLEELARRLPGATLVAYLDDLYILSKDKGSLGIAREVPEKSPDERNLAKSKEITIKDLKYHGLKTLGTYIGPLEGRRAFLEEKLDTLQQAIAALQDLPKQHSLLLLRGSIHLLLRHLLRQLNPEGLSDLWERAVILIKEAIITLVARSPAERPEEPDPYLFSLPVREGGLGLPLHKELAQGLYQAAKETAKKILKDITSFFKASCPSLPTSEAQNPSQDQGKSAKEGLYKALGSRPYLNVQIEPLVQQDSSLRADLAVTIGNSRNFYDIQIVAISKDSAKEDPYSTLKEAANEKRRKYQSLGAFFHPLTFSAGGLIDQETSQTYKKLQELLGPFAASQLDLTIGLALTKTKAISAASIARDLPRRTHS
ncbi:hypothetical protein HZ326_21771 [Fusarium oxysporum f. sp. albedinis]|nr:hypothetical protein HZ326_23332 [Fusarium oxysporum f. sp. albedinis]KAJ0135180.1 hypothetical protein HZ326_21771 [Fusarium oxysporum f. sp. albedinis]